MTNMTRAPSNRAKSWLDFSKTSYWENRKRHKTEVTSPGDCDYFCQVFLGPFTIFHFNLYFGLFVPFVFAVSSIAPKDRPCKHRPSTTEVVEALGSCCPDTHQAARTLPRPPPGTTLSSAASSRDCQGWTSSDKPPWARLCTPALGQGWAPVSWQDGRFSGGAGRKPPQEHQWACQSASRGTPQGRPPLRSQPHTPPLEASHSLCPPQTFQDSALRTWNGRKE